MSLADVVNVQVVLGTSTPSLPGFGVPLLLAQHSNFAERRRVYTDPADMLTDGFLSSDQVYLDALRLMSQAKKPRRFMVGRRETPVALVVTLTVGGTADGTYTVTLNDNDIGDPQEFSFAAVGQTATQIRDALVAAINGGTAKVTAAPDAADTLTLTADTAGIPFVASLESPGSDLTQAVTTPNVGIPEDLQAVTELDPDWYCLLIPERDNQSILTAAQVIEAQRRMFAAQSGDANIVDLAPGTPSSDVAARLAALGYARTHLWYEPDASDSLAAAIVGRMLPEIPASNTWKFKQLSGVAATALTDTQLLNLRGDPQGASQGKAANAYVPLAGLSITQEGTVASGEFIDVIRGVDKLVSRIQFLTLSLQVSEPKVNYDNRGIGLLSGKVREAIEESTREGLLAVDPAPEVVSPNALDIASVDKATRALSGSNAITFSATLAGAIHANEVTGTISA